MDKISVIVPVYNVEPYIRQCVDSIINQTYKNLEIILVDDGSPDNCGKICDEYATKDNRVKVLHIKNGGPAVARNAGLDIATGKYIGYVDSDDYIEPDMYETLYNAMIKTDAGLVVCNWFEGTENNWVKNTVYPKKEIVTSNEAFEIFYSSMYVWNKLFRKDVVKNLRFVETYAQDVLYTFTTFTRIEKVVCLQEYKCYYRINPTSRLHTKKFKKNFLPFLKVQNLEMIYAEKHKLFKLKEKIYNFRLCLLAQWLGFISLQEKPDRESANIVLKELKSNWFRYLTISDKISKKCFFLVACINFNLAGKIYKLVEKNF
ncbi:MAG: glycosyltransferase family 2 protein [Elusimicrobia bacterium]|nr:glycosyltransferase family 2 protein [Elusimicrobiota bacterium]